MEWFKKTFLICCGLLGTVSSKPLFGMSVGNPADPILLNKNECINIDKKDSKFGCKGSFELGFAGDYMFQQSVRMRLNPEYNKGSYSYNLESSGATFAYNVVDCTGKKVSMWDFGIFATISCSDLKIKAPLTAVFEESIYNKDFISKLGPLGYTSSIYYPEEGVSELLFKTAPSVSCGLRKVLYKGDKCVIGMSVQGMAADFRMSKLDVSVNKMFGNMTDDVLLTNNVRMRYYDATASLGAALKINEVFTPYVSCCFGHMFTKTKAVAQMFCGIDSKNNYSTYKFSLSPMITKQHLGVAAGVSCHPASDFKISLEGRWGYQRAVALKAEASF